MGVIKTVKKEIAPVALTNPIDEDMGSFGPSLHYPGNRSDGLPFRGTPQIYSKDDPSRLQPQVFYEPNVRVFELNDPKDLEAYRQVLSLCANGRAVLSVVDRQYDAELKNWRLLVHWTETYLQDAEVVKNRKLGL